MTCECRHLEPRINWKTLFRSVFYVVFLKQFYKKYSAEPLQMLRDINAQNIWQAWFLFRNKENHDCDKMNYHLVCGIHNIHFLTNI